MVFSSPSDRLELARAGRTPEELSREYEPTAQSIWNWVRQAERDEGIRQDSLTTDEKEELCLGSSEGEAGRYAVGPRSRVDIENDAEVSGSVEGLGLVVLVQKIADPARQRESLVL